MKKLTYENITHAKELSIYLEQGNKVLPNDYVSPLK